VVDANKEVERLEKRIAKLNKIIKRLEKKPHKSVEVSCAIHRRISHSGFNVDIFKTNRLLSILID